MTEIITIIGNILLALSFNVYTFTGLIGVLCFFLSYFLKKYIPKYIIVVIGFMFSFLAAYLTYWAPVWIGLSNSDQQSSWAPIFITMVIIGGLSGTFIGLNIKISLKKLFKNI
jgi:hypothetical protein